MSTQLLFVSPLYFVVSSRVVDVILTIELVVPHDDSNDRALVTSIIDRFLDILALDRHIQATSYSHQAHQIWHGSVIDVSVLGGIPRSSEPQDD